MGLKRPELSKPMIDLTGQKFGRLTAIRYAEPSKWLCHCDCGGKAIVFTRNLRKGNSTSCGCQRRETTFKHGMIDHPLYRVWIAMRVRCENPNDPSFHNYGGRGIKVCKRWAEFSNFIADMGMRPPGFELDRRDNDGDYTPKNCRWISKRENLNNKRTNHMITWQGETLPLTTWAERLGVPPGRLAHRIMRGWPIDKAFTYPCHARKNSRKRNA